MVGPSPRAANQRRELSVAILAGGRSARMQTDKAFLEYKGRPFISLIADEASRVSSDVLVVIGRKDSLKFESVLPRSVRVTNDIHHWGSPLGGMLTAFDLLGAGYTAVIACDTPFIRADILRFMHDSAVSHSAAVPRWESGKVEPLCSVYRVEEAGEAARRAMKSGGRSCRSMIALLADVNYVPVARLRELDPSLSSLANFNTPNDVGALRLVAVDSPTGTAGLGGTTLLRSGEEV